MTTDPRHRVDGPAKARGLAPYTADAAAPDALVGVVLTARSAHATVEVRAGGAMAVPGAVAVLGPDDAPAGGYGINPHFDDDVLSPHEHAVFNREARFAGDIVGLVVAEDVAAARRMAALVEVAEAPLPAVLDTDAAEAPGAPLVRAGLDANVWYRYGVGADPAEVDAAIDAAAVVVEHELTVEPGPVGSLERMAATARYSGGRWRFRSTTQTPQLLARHLARILDVEPGDIELEAVYVGGGYGGKEELFLEPLAAVASRACGGREVVVELDRRQVSALRRRHRARFGLRTGCDEDGTILARSVEVVLDAGASVGHSPAILWHATSMAAQLYPAPLVAAHGRVVMTNTTPSEAFRGYGGTEAVFAVESHVDEIARRFGIDPFEFRRSRVLRSGAVDLTNGYPITSFGAAGCLDVAEERSGARPARGEGRWRRGRGVALLANVSAITSPAHADSGNAACRVGDDGSIVVETGVIEMGQGNHTAFANVAAERVGIGRAHVRVEHGDASVAPFDPGPFASRGIYVSANAVAAAADALRAAILAAASARLGIDAGRLTLDGTTVRGGEGHVELAELAGLRAEGSATAPDTGLVAGAQVADVAVDTWTGRVVVERIVSVHDAGRIIDPDIARAQVVGGVVQGIGVALTERLRHDVDGRPIEVCQLDQPMPSSLDAPPVDVAFVTDGEVQGLLGAKGLGEATVVGVPAAVANAVRDAAGVRMASIPMLPELVADALDAAATPTEPIADATRTGLPI
ncbi:MAG: molybdopterin cofactor-binding domain-containing protein [Actinomycetota bacterium]|nr:molybdopterin cofactor-binding domain-containing protein [Actinomycetota bacterium]